MKIKKYSTERFILRPFTLRDYKVWFNTYTNLRPKQSIYDVGTMTARQCSLKKFQARIERHKKRAASDITYIWAIFDKENGTLVGSIDIHILYRGHVQKANLGYFIYNNYWRQGIAYEALSELIPQALIDLKLNRLEASIDQVNKPSVGLAKSLGLRSEGIRESYYNQNGKWHDQMIFVADRKLYKLPALKLK